MFEKEEIALFALEELFEKVAADPALNDAARLRALQNVLQSMHGTVQAGFRHSPVLGAHLTDLALDYLAREDLAPSVVKTAFNKHAAGVLNLNQRILQRQIDKTVREISSSLPYLAATR